MRKSKQQSFKHKKHRVLDFLNSHIEYLHVHDMNE